MICTNLVVVVVVWWCGGVVWCGGGGGWWCNKAHQYSTQNTFLWRISFGKYADKGLCKPPHIGHLTRKVWVWCWNCTEGLTKMSAWWSHHFPGYCVFYEGNPPVTGEFPWQRLVSRSMDDYFDQRLNKQSRRRTFDMISLSWWRHR